jgi:hypothetical protein
LRFLIIAASFSTARPFLSLNDIILVTGCPKTLSFSINYIFGQ